MHRLMLRHGAKRQTIVQMARVVIQTERNRICHGRLAWIDKSLWQQFKQRMAALQAETQSVRTRKCELGAGAVGFVRQQGDGIGRSGYLAIGHGPTALGLPLGIGQFEFVLYQIYIFLLIFFQPFFYFHSSTYL